MLIRMSESSVRSMFGVRGSLQRGPGVLRRTLWMLLVALPMTLPARGDDQRYDWTEARELCPGVRYAGREVAASERPTDRVSVHALQVDTRNPALAYHTTARRQEWTDGQVETDRQTTRNFLRQARASGVPMVVAINADAFSPWPAPFNQETPTDLLGLAVADGMLVSSGSGTPSLVRTKAGDWRIEVAGPTTDIADIDLAVSGFGLCLAHGEVVAGGADRHPRTGLGLSADRRHLVAVLIDGRQPASVGATTAELGRWLLHFGADHGINMDGGGSTTLVWWDPQAAGDDKTRLLNRPVGNGINASAIPASLFQPTERANGNNLGVSWAGAQSE